MPYCFPPPPPPLWAAEHQVTGGTGTALNTAFTNADQGDTITISGSDVAFPGSTNAIIIHDTDLTLRGSVNGNFDSKIGSLCANMGNVGGVGITGQAFQNWTQSWASAYNPTSLFGITGDSTARQGTSFVTGDQAKWLASEGANPASANGLSLANLRLHDVDVEYQNERYVNGVIGNHHDAAAPISMKDITGNAFGGTQ